MGLTKQIFSTALSPNLGQLPHPSTQNWMGNLTNWLVESISNLIYRLQIDYKKPSNFTSVVLVANFNGNHVSTDYLAPFGPIWMIPTVGPHGILITAHVWKNWPSKTCIRACRGLCKQFLTVIYHYKISSILIAKPLGKIRIIQKRVRNI